MEQEMNIPTPHIEVAQLGVIAPTVLMPGDPLRAKFIADNFLTNVVQFNAVRNMFGYSGYYKGKPVSVMGSGMGMPSVGIYSYELFKFYEVDNIIRIGTAGSYTQDLNLYDIVLVKEAWSESSYAQAQSGFSDKILSPSSSLNQHILTSAAKLNIDLRTERVHCSDVFYREDFNSYKEIQIQHGCACVEMESFALFANAKVLNKHAACVLTISDSLVSHAVTTSEERQSAFTTMMSLVLESL
jgi:purine-nucleoside phosphorylase